MSDESTNTASRRGFLVAAGAAGILGTGGMVYAQQDQVATSYLLDGRVAGWQGREPASIADAVNPTLRLEAGSQYEITWVNVDGLPHNVAILNQSGEVVERTPIISGQGERQTLTFTATEEMVEYICQVHPTSMQGPIQMGGDGGAAPNQTQTQTPTRTEKPPATEAPTETPQGTPTGEFGEGPRKFVAEMAPRSGVSTNARATTYFTLHPPNGVRAKLMYSTYVRNVDSAITGMHIHLNRSGDDDPVVAPLYQPENPIDCITGTLVDDLISAPDLVGPFANASLARLIEAIRNDEVFVQLHTEDHPSGLLRGPISAVSRTDGTYVD